MMMLMVVVVVIILLVHVRVWQDGGTRRPNGELIYKPLERENQHFHHLLNFFLIHLKIVLQTTGDSRLAQTVAGWQAACEDRQNF